MSFQKARECFVDNCDRIGDPGRDPLIYNLNAGLQQLTLALEAEIKKLHDALGVVSGQVHELSKK
jgi:hypothetical protein